MDTFAKLVNFVIEIITKSLIPFLSTLIFFVFLVGVVKYIKGGDNEDTRKEGARFMIISVIILFVLVSIFGLVALITQTFGINTSIPQI